MNNGILEERACWMPLPFVCKTDRPYFATELLPEAEVLEHSPTCSGDLYKKNKNKKKYKKK